MRRDPKHFKMELTDLPSEITIDILSILPPRTTLFCKLKCVCKSWRELIETPEFAKSNKLAPCLAIFQEEDKSSKPYNVCEEVELDDENTCINEVFNFSFPHPPPLHSSVDDLLLLLDHSKFTAHHNLIICNPITRDYIKIPSPHFNSMPVVLLDME